MSSTKVTSPGELNSTTPLPLTVEEVNAAWFSRILGVKVKEEAIVDLIHGTASKIILKLTYEEEKSPDVTPPTVCVKGGFREDLRKLGLNRVYRAESEFFYYVAPNVSLRLPKTWYAGTDVVSGQGIVVLEDLTAKKCTFGECLEPWPAARVAEGLEQLAELHAKTWGAAHSEYPWCTSEMRGVIEYMMSPGEWDKRFTAADVAPPVPAGMINRERMLAAFRTLWKAADKRFYCILHGDPHVGNTFMLPTGEPGFIDWQGPHPGSAFHDVAYFLVGAMSIEDRRAHERELLGHYLRALHAAGGPKFGVEDIWQEYTYQNLHGFVWPLSGPLMQTKERVDAMTLRHCAAMEDHKTLEGLEALPEHEKV